MMEFKKPAGRLVQPFNPAIEVLLFNGIDISAVVSV